MASFRGHLAFAGALGFVYGGMAHSELEFDTATAVLGAGLTTVGGLLPDLDSDSGVPVRELFGLAAAVVPMLLFRRLMNAHFNDEELFVWLGGIYVFIRYILSRIFKKLTVHRGMFHSIPAMLIAGMIVFLAYHHPLLRTRVFLAVGVMIGFLSHLVLDELYSVDFRGLKITLNKYAGSAVKFFSPSWIANTIAYILLLIVIYFTLLDLERSTEKQILPASAKPTIKGLK